MDIRDRDSFGREIASKRTFFVVDRYGYTRDGEIDHGSSAAEYETPSWAEARRIWLKCVKSPDCPCARIYRMHFFYDASDRRIGEHRVGLNDCGESADWIDVADEHEYLEL
tara:strand:- start:129 stop:461 length:333 start_codon:yes stop_codon:yes gene_type:complete